MRRASATASLSALPAFSSAARFSVPAFVIALVGSVLLFCNQERFQGYAVRAWPELGDIGAFVGFAIAFVAYLILARRTVEDSQVRYAEPEAEPAA